MEEEDFFSDDDLEGIADNTLQELEEQAWTSTQKQAAAPAPNFRKQAHNASSLNRSGGLNPNLPWRPPQRSQSQSTQVNAAPAPSVPRQADPDVFDEYGLDDEVVVDLNDTSAIPPPSARVGNTLPDSQAQRQYGVLGARSGVRAPPDSQTEAAFAAADAQLARESFSHIAPRGRISAGSTDVFALQAKIEQLEAEQARLRHAAQEARNLAMAKQGEIAIVRSNHDKASKEYERRLAALQKQHSDESSRHQAELDSRGKEMEKMQTDNRFLQHEVAQEAERSKRRNGPGLARTAPTSRDSPRKSRKQALGDGFDDDEVQKVNPNRSRDKSREGTPKAGAKRKRPAPDSPITSLSFSHAPRLLEQESSESSLPQPDSLPTERANQRDDGRNEFMRRFLAHTPQDSLNSSIEALTGFFFPSAPSKSVSSLLMGEVTRLFGTDTAELSLLVCRVLLGLWKRCLEEKYWAPFSLILNLLRYLLYFELFDVASSLIEQAIPLCCEVIDLFTIHITKVALTPAYQEQVDWKAQERLEEDVDPIEVLEFLLSLCHASSISPERIETFWRTVDASFAFTLLSKALPSSYIIVMLQMLRTSIFGTTFGPLFPDTDLQAKSEHGAMARLTDLLFEVPQVPQNEPAYTDEEIAELRIEVLELLQSICLTEHGGSLIAAHRSAIGRIVRFLDGQISKLYETRPSIGMWQGDDQAVAGGNAHDLIVKTVNLAMRIFYHVLRTFEESIDIIQKLNMVQGGYHKFLVSLTRIAFSEQLVLEAGIEEEVIGAAHSILDNFLSPEDGDAIVKAVETPRGTRGSATEKDTTSEEQSQQDDEDSLMRDVG